MKKEFTHIERKGLPGGPNEMFTYVTGVFSMEGYKRNSPDVSNPFNIIPSGNITMKDVDFPVMGTDNLGNSEMMMPGNDYQFPGDQVFEVPMAKKGGGLLTKTMKCNDCGWSWKAADGGKDVSTCHKCGGSALPKAQEGKELPTVMTPEMTVQAFPNATPIQKAALSTKSGNPIYRNAKSQLMNNKKPGNFVNETSDAFGYLVAGAPTEGLQTPQSLLVEGIEAARGNDYNFKDALPQYVSGNTNKQRLPSQTFLQNAPLPLQLAGDILIDPFVVASSAKGGFNLLRTGLKNFSKAFALNLDDVGRQAFKPTEELVDLWRIQSKDFKNISSKELIKRELKKSKAMLYKDIKDKYLSKIGLAEKQNYDYLINFGKNNLKQIPKDPLNTYYGRWASNNPEIIKKYHKYTKTRGGFKRFKNPEILQFKVPKSKLKNYNVGEMAKKDKLLHYTSKDHINEYIVPDEYSTPIRKYEVEDWVLKYQDDIVKAASSVDNVGSIINRYKSLPKASEWLGRRQFIKNLQEEGLIGKDFTTADVNYATRSLDKTNKLTQLALNRYHTGFRSTTGKIPLGGIGRQSYTDKPFNMSKPAYGQSISEFENMSRAGVDFKDPRSIAEYQATHIPLEDYGYRATGDYPTSKYGFLFRSPTPTKSDMYGKFQFKGKPSLDYSNGKYSDWFKKYYSDLNYHHTGNTYGGSTKDKLASIEKVLWEKRFDPRKPKYGKGVGDVTFVGPRGTKAYDIDPDFMFTNFDDILSNPTLQKNYDEYIKKFNRQYDTGWRGEYQDGGPLPIAQQGVQLPLGLKGQLFSNIPVPNINWAKGIPELEGTENRQGVNVSGFNLSKDIKLRENLDLNLSNPAIAYTLPTLDNRPVSNVGKFTIPFQPKVGLTYKFEDGGPLPIAQVGNGEYTVESGNTFDGIANKLGINKQALRQVNPGINYNQLQVGQTIKYPVQNKVQDPVQKPEPTSWGDYMNPMNWGVSDRDDDGDFKQAFRAAREAGEDEFMWYGTRYSTDLKPTANKSQVQVEKASDKLEPAKETKPPEGKTEKYTVKSGDTFGDIVNKKEVSKYFLKKVNPNVDYDNLKVGQVINLPDKKKDILGVDEIENYLTIINGQTPDFWKSTADTIAFHESGPWQSMDPKAIQRSQNEKTGNFFEGPGEGVFQMETERAGGKNSFKQFKNRYESVADKLNMYADPKIINASRPIDLSLEEQYALFYTNLIEEPNVILKDYAQGDMSLIDLWLAGHKKVEKPGDRDAFRTSVGRLKEENTIFKKSGGEVDEFQIYANYINGSYNGTEMETKAEKIYDKLNRVYYRKAKALDMSAPNYIMSNIINRSGQ